MFRTTLDDRAWAAISPLFPPERGRSGRPALPNRPMAEAILWRARTGSPWRDLPTEYGPWQSAYTRFRRWSISGVWRFAMDSLIGLAEPDLEWLMVDATINRVHQHGAGARKKKGSTARPSGGRAAA